MGGGGGGRGILEAGVMDLLHPRLKQVGIYCLVPKINRSIGLKALISTTTDLESAQ